MTDDREKGEGQPAAPARNLRKDSRQKTSRQDRLKLALRENLKRRKSQARGRGDLASESFNIDDVSPYNDGITKPGK